MENRKAALIVIILLLVISVPCSIFGIVYKYVFLNRPAEIETTKRPNEEFFQNGVLNFYEYGELLGQYTCKNPQGYCGWAYETNDDDTYSLRYYNDNSIDTIFLVSNRYAFILDVEEEKENYKDDNIILYDVLSKKEVGIYKGVKDYSIGINNNYYIVQDENSKWGVIQLTKDGMTETIPFEYDYIGLQEKLDSQSSKIVSNVFAVLKNKEWYLIDLSNSQLSKPVTTPIISYNNDSMIVNYYSKESLFNLQGIIQLNGQSYNHIEYVKQYVGYIDNDNNFSVIDYNNDNNLITKDLYPVNNYKDIELRTNDDENIDIYISGEFKETVE